MFPGADFGHVDVANVVHETSTLIFVHIHIHTCTYIYTHTHADDPLNTNPILYQNTQTPREAVTDLKTEFSSTAGQQSTPCLF